MAKKRTFNIDKTTRFWKAAKLVILQKLQQAKMVKNGLFWVSTFSLKCQNIQKKLCTNIAVILCNKRLKNTLNMPKLTLFWNVAEKPVF